MSNNALLEVA